MATIAQRPTQFPRMFGAGFVDVGTWWKLGGIISVVNIVIWLGIGGLWWKVLGLW